MCNMHNSISKLLWKIHALEIEISEFLKFQFLSREITFCLPFEILIHSVICTVFLFLPHVFDKHLGPIRNVPECLSPDTSQPRQRGANIPFETSITSIMPPLLKKTRSNDVQAVPDRIVPPSGDSILPYRSHVFGIGG